MARSIIEVFINGDTRGLERSLERAQGSVGRFGDSVKRRLGASVASAIAAVGAGKLIHDSIGLASDLDETISKTTQLFGAQTDHLLGWGKSAADAIGLSQVAALDAASNFAIMGDKAGLTGGPLADFSTGLTELAADMASFNNTSIEDAIAAIGSGLRGEAEPLRKYGVLLDDATLKAEAMKLGIWDGTGSLTAQQKVLAAQAAILAQTTKQQGDFARTSGGLANQQRILKARFENVQAELGRKLLPVALKVTTFISDEMVPAIADTVNAIKGVVKWMKEARLLGPVLIGLGAAAAVGFGVWAAAALSAAAATIAAAAVPIAIGLAIAAFVAGLVYAWRRSETFRAIVTGVFETVKRVVTAAIDAVVKVITGWVDVVKNTVKLIVAIFKGDWGDVKAALAGIFGGFKDAMLGPFEGVLGWLRGLGGKILEAIGDLGGLLWRTGENIIEGLHDGLVWVWDRTLKVWLVDIPWKVISAIGYVGDLLYNVGKSIINGLLDGLKDAWDAVKGWFEDRINDVKGWWGQITGQGPGGGVPGVNHDALPGPDLTTDLGISGRTTGRATASGGTTIVVQLDGRTILEQIVRANDLMGGPLVLQASGMRP